MSVVVLEDAIRDALVALLSADSFFSSGKISVKPFRSPKSIVEPLQAVVQVAPKKVKARNEKSLGIAWTLECAFQEWHRITEDNSDPVYRRLNLYVDSLCAGSSSEAEACLKNARANLASLLEGLSLDAVSDGDSDELVFPPNYLGRGLSFTLLVRKT